MITLLQTIISLGHIVLLFYIYYHLKTIITKIYGTMENTPDPDIIKSVRNVLQKNVKRKSRVIGIKHKTQRQRIAERIAASTPQKALPDDLKYIQIKEGRQDKLDISDL